MKNTEITKRLKSESKALLPDSGFKDSIKDELFSKEIKVTAPENRVKFWNLQKLTAVATVLILVATAIVLAIVFKKDDGINPPVTTTEQAVKEAYAFSAFSAGMILGSFDEASGTASAAAADATDEQVEFINKYINMVDSILTSAPSVTEISSDRAEYSVKLQVMSYDLFGNSYNYFIYYNETQSETSEEDSTIAGIMLIGDEVYTVSGEKTVEGGEFGISLNAYLDENNYVIVEQGIDTAEKEYSYKVYESGEMVNSFGFKINKDGNSTEANIRISEGTAVTNFSYSVKKNTSEIEIVISDSESATTATVLVRCQKTGNSQIYRYEYGGGKVVEHNNRNGL